MSNFTQFLNYLETFSSEKKGKVFELYCKWFLENDPRYAAQIKRVWLWKDWPDRWGIEKGIDLIAETYAGQLWAIQAKAYDKEYYITKDDVNSFLSESARAKFSFRLFIATTNKLGPNARETISGQEKEVSLCLLDKLEESILEWPSSVEDLKIRIKVETKTPRPHQKTALDNILKGFKDFNRGQLHMACGTGKTLVGLWAAQSLNSKNTLVLVPSISLVAQLYAEWVQNRDNGFNFDPIFVCSDDTVYKKDDEIDQLIAQTEFGFPITTNAQELLDSIKFDSERSKVIFSTYHSSSVVVQACKLDSSLNFDLAIADEAHRCAGSLKSDFTLIVNEKAIRASKRLFMTATPKIFSNNVKQKTKEIEYEIASMDDEAKFGPVFHKLSFSEAIKNDLLSDYQVLISVMDNMTYREYAQRGRFVAFNDHETDARTLASQLLAAKSMKEFDLARVITFHNRKSSARDFITTFDKALKLLPENERPEIALKETIFGEMLQSERKKILKKLQDSKVGSSGLIANVKCLSEGVDVPSLDAIAFIDPKGSEIDIVQAVGRAIRKASNKKSGMIIIPIFIDKESDEEIDLNESCFKVIWKVVKALRAHDDILAEELDNIRLELGRRIYKKPTKLAKIVIDLPIGIDINFGKALKLKILGKIVEDCSAQWFSYFGQLLEFREQNPHRWPSSKDKDINEKSLGMWCVTQRKVAKKGKILSERKQLLNSIGFTWNYKDDLWNYNFNNLCDFRNLNPNSWPSTLSGSDDIIKLANWCGTQRTNYRIKKLSLDRIQSLDSIGFIWHSWENSWNFWFRELEKYRIENPNKWPSQKSKCLSERKLGRWCSDQRQDRKNNNIAEDKILALNNLQFSWDELETEWNSFFNKLKEFRNMHPLKWPSNKSKNDEEAQLARWCGTQRKAYKKGKLSPMRVNQLSDLGFRWDPFNEKWDQQFAYLIQFRINYPSTWPTRWQEFPTGNKLGYWCHTQRRNYKKNQMNEERKELLNSIKFPWQIHIS